MAARVCIGCGLTTNSDGELIVNTDNAVWPYPCDQENFGSDVYCSPADGALRVAPPVAVRGVEHYDVRTYESREVPDEPTAFATDNFTVTNPSTCYSALFDYTITLDFDLNVREDGRVRVRLDGIQIFDYTNRGDATVSQSGWNVSRRYTQIIAPGASFTVTPDVELFASGTGATITSLQQDIVGTIFAAPNISRVSTGP